MRNTETTERPVDCDCSSCGCQYGVERTERTENQRTEFFRWCQDCGEESE